MIFPDWGQSQTASVNSELPLFQEWAVDWEREAFALRDGQPYLVSGDQALKIWVRRALHMQSQRFEYTAWSFDYGNELRSLLGYAGNRGILESLLRRYIRDALLISPYIREVDGFSFSYQNSKVAASFSVTTVYNGFQEQTEVVLL